MIFTTQNKNGKKMVFNTDKYPLLATINGIRIYLCDLKGCDCDLYPAFADINNQLVFIDRTSFKTIAKGLGLATVTLKDLDRFIVIQHELAHIIFKTHDESLCDRYAIQQYLKSGGVVETSIERVYAIQIFNACDLGRLRGDDLATMIAGITGIDKTNDGKVDLSDPHFSKFRFNVMAELLKICREIGIA